MIAGCDVRKLEIAANVVAVLLKQPQQKLSVELRRTAKQVRRDEQIDRPQSDFHCTRPVWTTAIRVLLAPAAELLYERGRIALIFRDFVSASERNEVPQTI